MNSLLHACSSIQKLVALDLASYPAEFVLVTDQFDSDISGEFLLFHFIAAFLKEQQTKISIFSYQSIPNAYYSVLKRIIPSFDRERVCCNDAFGGVELDAERFVERYVKDDVRLFVLDGLANLSLLMGDQDVPLLIKFVGTLFKLLKERGIAFLVRSSSGTCRVLDLYLSYLLENEVGLDLKVRCLKSGESNKDANGLLEVNSFDGKERHQLNLLFKFMDNCQVNFFPK